MAKPRRRLTAMPLLAGQTEEITLMDFRKAPGDVIAQVQMGKTFTLTSYGQPVATLSAYEPSALELGATLQRMSSAY
jgi:antitoxin (DNA-binding transcriptional repressor) of toxin-antitoxin stability system